MARLEADLILGHLHKLLDCRSGDKLRDEELLDRFTARHDEEAFAALVERHGPMVLSVCRRVLHESHDVEDAFQATFLVLARKGGAIRKRKAISCWLHGVAYRVAARLRGARTREHHLLVTQECRTAADPAAEANRFFGQSGGAAFVQRFEYIFCCECRRPIVQLGHNPNQPPLPKWRRCGCRTYRRHRLVGPYRRTGPGPARRARRTRRRQAGPRWSGDPGHGGLTR